MAEKVSDRFEPQFRLRFHFLMGFYWMEENVSDRIENSEFSIGVL